MAKEAERLEEQAGRIAQLRRDAHETQPEVADAVGVALRTYQLWEAADADPKGRNLKKLADHFKVGTRYIEYGEPPRATPDLLGTLEPQKIQEQLDRIAEAIDSLAEQLEAVRQLTDLLSRQHVLDALTRLSEREEPTPSRTRARARDLPSA